MEVLEWDGGWQTRDMAEVTWLRVLRLSTPELGLLLLGVLMAALQGAIFPSFSIFFGQALEDFTFPFNQVSAIFFIFGRIVT